MDKDPVGRVAAEGTHRLFTNTPADPKTGWTTARKLLAAAVGAVFIVILFVPAARVPALLIAVASFPFSVKLRADAFLRRSRAKIVLLAREGGANAVGVLLETLDDDDTLLSGAAREGLVRILPTLDTADIANLTRQHKVILLNYLDRPWTPGLPLTAAILKMLGNADDETFLPIVTRLANGRGSGEHADIRLAAEECLSHLSARIENRRARNELLRESASPTGAAADTLLRAAGSGPAESGDKLLRAHTGEE